MKEYDIGEEKVKEQIKEGLDRLDKEISMSTPDMNYFRLMIEGVEKKREARRTKESRIFFFLSLIILFIEVYSFRQSMLIFAFIQVIAAFSIPAALIIRWAVKGRRVEI